MGKIPVQELARMMGIANQDLVFKLKSIGVRVEGDEAIIDTEAIQAILQGKKLAGPREVILRDEPAPEPKRGVAQRRPALNPLRPTRPRQLIQRIEPRIKTIPASERPAPPPQAGAPHAPEAAAQAAAAPAHHPEPAAPSRYTAPSSPPAMRRPGLAPAGRPPLPARPGRPGVPAGPPPKSAAELQREREREREKRRKGIKKPAGAAAETADTDLRAYVGSVQEIAAAEEAQDAEMTARRRRRAEQKKAEEEAGKVLAFKKDAPAGAITLSEGMTVRQFADKLGVKSRDLIKLLFDRGVVANINHVLEPGLGQKLAEELGVEAMVVTFEEEVQLRREQEPGRQAQTGRAPRAPVVTIMGHVDHGKTSLLDAIRSSKITESEFGGITQHIGAYHVEVGSKRIVFLDTPGHEAFTLMRARGARVTDIVILVVAADDGVMPQTVEAIDHAQAASVPILVAINKIDKPNANQDRVKKELSDRGLLVEEWGGQTVAVPISAIKREGIDQLLEMVLLTADLLELKASPEIPGQGVVLEARKEPGRGVIGTVLVQNGTLRVGDVFVAGATWGRVRAMADDRGARVDVAPPATPVEVTGFSEVPAAGDPFQVVGEEAKAREIVDFRRQEQRNRDLAPTQGGLTLDQLFSQIQEGQVKELPVVLKADVQGSVEVLRDTLAKLSTDKVKVNVIHTAVGAISTNDVLLASASKAIILGFNVRPERNAAELAEKEGVDIRLHTVIYELADELRKAMAGLLEPTFKEVARGRAEVREIFKVPKVGMVAGCHVVEGTIPRAATVRLVRDGRVVYEGKISSLRRFKDDVSEVRSGFDCGIALDRYQDVKPGDTIEAFAKEQVAAVL